MKNQIDDILKHMRTVSGNNLIAGSIMGFLKNETLTTPEIMGMVKQIKDQIQDNPQVMQEILPNSTYLFFSKYTID